MKNTRNAIFSALIVAGLGLASAATPAFAHRWDRNDRREYREYREDLRDLRDAQREYRQDLHDGAGPRELARDRAAIERERRELAESRRDLDDNYWRWRRDDEHYRRGWWDDWYRGWWR